MKTGIIDIGGGMRDIYGAGVLDYCIEHGLTFDYCIGVSAGSANLASFLAGQKGRNYVFYTEYAFKKEYISFGNWLRDRNFVNLEYSYGTLSRSDGEYPLDFQAIMANKAQFSIVATDALTGRPRYFDKSDMKQDEYNAIKASSCVPVANKAYMIDGHPYFDGGISDPIPIKKCLDAGCEKIILIITRPKEYRRDADNDRLAVRVLKRRYPVTSRVMSLRARTYNRSLDEAVSLEKDGKVLILAPDDIGKMKTLSKDREEMERLYKKGLKDAEKISEFLLN